MFDQITQTLATHGVKLVAVSKTHPAARILELYQHGQRIFGENRVQEMLLKQAALPADIDWHLIGHLQSNKVKQIAPFVAMIHSVDSLPLLLEIEKQAQKNGRILDCLLQFHIATEETKFGLSLPEAREILQDVRVKTLTQTRICGVMGMATFTDDPEQVRQEFRALKSIFDTLRRDYFSNSTAFSEISMGMSGDWEIAVAEGSTMVRIGSLLFGAR
jgi:pyridoxal phosphate enzyme (YggS family)